MKITNRSLLSADVIGPLLFVVVFLIEGATRPGYSAWRNFVSQLATGDGGWMQVVNFLVCGTLMLGFAIGLRESLGSGRASIAAPILFGAFGGYLWNRDRRIWHHDGAHRPWHRGPHTGKQKGLGALRSSKIQFRRH